MSWTSAPTGTLTSSTDEPYRQVLIHDDPDPDQALAAVGACAVAAEG
jgi:hypothetical protein